jgi:hypothetical protein
MSRTRPNPTTAATQPPGVCNNLREILGEGPDEWLWPPLKPTPGGTAYPTVYDPDVNLPAYKL